MNASKVMQLLKDGRQIILKFTSHEYMINSEYFLLEIWRTMDDLIHAVQMLTEEVRLLRQELRPELRKSEMVRDVKQQQFNIHNAAAEFVTTSSALLAEKVHTTCTGDRNVERVLSKDKRAN